MSSAGNHRHPPVALLFMLFWNGKLRFANEWHRLEVEVPTLLMRASCLVHSGAHSMCVGGLIRLIR